MIKKILIANRGEIAIRIIRACRELGIETVAVYSEADANCLHTKFADQSICIGNAKPISSYLNIPSIISACEVTAVDAIHPGYGFLSENPDFVEVCKTNKIEFIGPPLEAMLISGDKIKARKIAKNCGVPVIPGSEDKINSIEEAIELAEKIGYPVMIKAALGGGGRGIRIANNREELEKTLNIAKTEAKTTFGDESIYIEKYIHNPRHIEMQIIADNYGNIIWLGERECSIQRRHQKLMEESPSPIVNDRDRKKIGEYAVKIAKAIGYKSVGTIEFLRDEHNNFYFIEINARIQVEHPVTEMVTGIDIIKEQIKIANNEKLSIKQEDIKINGTAIECRINAENTEKNFMPSPGKISALYIPGGPGIRVDTHIYGGYEVPKEYDSLIAKLIAHAYTREECIKKLEHALEEFLIEGIHTTIPLYQKIIKNNDFLNANFNTNFIDNLFKV